MVIAVLSGHMLADRSSALRDANIPIGKTGNERMLPTVLTDNMTGRRISVRGQETNLVLAYSYYRISRGNLRTNRI